MKKIYFVGMPASGKSTLAKLVAGSLKLQFLDLDQVIETKSQATIADLFKNEGESAFRELESNCLIEKANTTDSFVMATGGGTPCFFDNMEVMNRTGITVYLDVSNDELERRINEQKKSRPLFEATDLMKSLTKMKLERESAYLKSKLIITSDDSDVDDILSGLESQAHG